MPIESLVEACLSTSEVQAIIAGRLSASDEQRVRQHAATCDRCLNLLKVVGYSIDAPTSDTTCGHKSEQATGADVLQFAGGEGRIATQALPTAEHGAIPPTRGDGEIRYIGGYRIVRELGAGGMGVVYEAEDPKLGRHVAIKMLRPGQVDETQQRRFLQEAKLAASLSSERIVTIYQVGEEQGWPFIVMELLRGESLEARLERNGAMRPADALRIAREVAEGLAAAHVQQLVHRDIKPANVWLEDRSAEGVQERAKLLDFGIARPLSEHGNLTISGQVIGTPSYMSPEQAKGLPVDERTDLFSLGCLMFAMITGKSPYEGTNYLQVIRAIVDREPPSLAGVRDLPQGVERLVGRLLKKEPASRIGTARQVVDELKQIEGNLARRRWRPTDTAMISQTSIRRIRQRLGWGGWCGALAILAAMAVGAWVTYERMSGKAGRTNGAQAASAEETASVGSSTTTPMALTASREAAGPKELATPDAADLPTIKVGILHSLTGSMAGSERSIVDSWVMAFDEINENGGVLGGRQVEVLVRDGQSDESVFAQQAEELIAHEHVVTLFGCWRSPCRKSVEAVCRRLDNLLVYPVTYEGVEQSPNVIYMGGAPNQQVSPAVKWAFAFLNKRKFFLIGADGIYSHTLHAIIRDELKSLGGTVVGEEYQALGATEFASIARKVAESGADMVINTVSGTGNLTLFSCLRRAGVRPPEVATLSFKVSEEELQNIAATNEELVGDYAAWSYFEQLANDQNAGFLERLRARYGPARVANDPMAVAYSAAYLWAGAVDQCNSDKTADIRRAILEQTCEVPEGELSIDADNQHAFRRAMIGEVNRNRQYDIVWHSPSPIPPQPFPATRSRDQWQTFQRELYDKWHGHWRPDSTSNEQ